jgi:hypothetical protein
MYIQINLEQFRTAFATHHNGQYANQFTYEGLRQIFEYTESMEDDIASPAGIELDVVAFSCEYAEYNLVEMRAMLGVDADTSEQDLLELLETRTIVVGKTPTTIVVGKTPTTIVVHQF